MNILLAYPDVATIARRVPTVLDQVDFTAWLSRFLDLLVHYISPDLTYTVKTSSIRKVQKNIPIIAALDAQHVIKVKGGKKMAAPKHIEVTLTYNDVISILERAPYAIEDEEDVTNFLSDVAALLTDYFGGSLAEIEQDDDKLPAVVVHLDAEALADKRSSIYNEYFNAEEDNEDESDNDTEVTEDDEVTDELNA